MKTAFILSLVVVSIAAQERAQAQNLDTTSFVVMGEGLAAGMGNYGLSSVLQSKDFAVLVANQMGTALEQPLIQPPGIGDIVGYPQQEVIVQRYPQGSVRQFYYPTDLTKAPIQTPPIFVTNVSVPGLTLNDALTMIPVSPVVQRANMKQTVFNMILGFPQLILDNIPAWTQLQYAEELNPTVAMVELGYYEALTAAVAGDPTLMPDPTSFGKNYGTVVSGLRGLQSQVIVTTIPNPIDTAYFNSLLTAANVVQALPSVLSVNLGISPADYVTRNGMQEIVNSFAAYAATFTGLPPLPAGSTLSAATATAITNNVNALNAQIVSVAKANGAVVYDLNAFLHKVKVSGASTGAGTVTGDYLGGFYSLDAVYPSATGHVLIANDILTFLNSTYHKSFSLVNVAPVAANDPATQFKIPTNGGVFTPNNFGGSRQ